MPSIIKTLLGIVVIYAGVAPESFNIKNFAPTNVGAFLNPIETNKALYAFASSLDVITIWSMVLLAIGMAAVAGVKRGSGYIAVFGWWVIIVLISVGAGGHLRMKQNTPHKRQQREPGEDSRCWRLLMKADS